jgi:hypothetical protein
LHESQIKDVVYIRSENALLHQKYNEFSSTMRMPKSEDDYAKFKQAYKLLSLKYRKFAGLDPTKYKSTLLKNKKLKGYYIHNNY